MFSFKSGNPVAIIKGGQYDGELLYIKDDENESDSESENELDSDEGPCCSRCSSRCLYQKQKCCKACRAAEGGCCVREESSEDDEELPYLGNLQVLDDHYFPELRARERMMRLHELKNQIERRRPPKSGSGRKIYDEAKNMVNDASKKELILMDADIIPIPETTQGKRSCIYVSGPAGSGKSTFVSNFAEQYKKLFPGNDIIVFSRLESDPVIDKLHPKRVVISEKLIEKKMKSEDIPASLVIFDDCDTIRDKKVKNEVMNIKDDLLEVGRHDNVNVCICSHVLNNYKETKLTFVECDSIILFPKMSSFHDINYCLKNYLGFGKEDIKKIMKIPSRWVMIKKRAPQCVLWEHGAYMLNKE